MSRAILISIRPKWCELIASGKKTIEVRKTRPKIDTPFRCYIYETRGYERVGNENLNCIIGGSGRGKVIGEFVCDKIKRIDIPFPAYWPELDKSVETVSDTDYHSSKTSTTGSTELVLHRGG